MLHFGKLALDNISKSIKEILSKNAMPAGIEFEIGKQSSKQISDFETEFRYFLKMAKRTENMRMASRIRFQSIEGIVEYNGNTGNSRYVMMKKRTTE